MRDKFTRFAFNAFTSITSSNVKELRDVLHFQALFVFKATGGN